MQLCTLCRRYFPGSTCLHMHQKTHHKTRLNDDIILKCSYCSGVFREQSSLEEHVRFFHLEEECLICGHISVGAFESYEHIGEFHSPLYIPGNIIRILKLHIVLYYICLQRSDAGRWKTLGVPAVIGGDNLPSPVVIGLTDLPPLRHHWVKSGFFMHNFWLPK